MNVGSISLGDWRAIRFELDKHAVPHSSTQACRADYVPERLAGLQLVTGVEPAVDASRSQDLPTSLQQLPGFDNETFIRAMGVSDEGISVLWRR